MKENLIDTNQYNIDNIDTSSEENLNMFYFSPIDQIPNRKQKTKIHKGIKKQIKSKMLRKYLGRDRSHSSI